MCQLLLLQENGLLDSICILYKVKMTTNGYRVKADQQDVIDAKF